MHGQQNVKICVKLSFGQVLLCYCMLTSVIYFGRPSMTEGELDTIHWSCVKAIWSRLHCGYLLAAGRCLPVGNTCSCSNYER